MSTVTKPILLDETFSEKMDKQNALLEVLAASALESLSTDWIGLKLLANSGLFGETYNIGDRFSDVWTDIANNNTKYTYPYQLNHIGSVELDDGEILENRPFLQAHYAHPFGVQFSHQRAFLKCPSGLAAGTYYVTLNATWGSNVTAGDIVSFTLPSDIDAGCRIAGCYGAPDQVKSNWNIYVDRKSTRLNSSH
mgnify:CR=1 FL=1